MLSVIVPGTWMEEAFAISLESEKKKLHSAGLESIYSTQDLNFSTPILLSMLVGLSLIQITPNFMDLQLD